MDEHNNNDNKMYSFGVEFKYGYNGEEAHYDSIAVSPKYSSLKQELTTNPISTISIEQFIDEYKKASIHFECEYRKQHYSNIKIEYLLALMFYCNFDELQNKLSKTYRENNGIYHNNYYHFGKLLKIAVKIYGTTIHKGDIKAFYHGIGEELLLPQYNGNGYGWCGVQIFCPLSTSSSRTVAANFTNNNNGLIIEFGGDVFGCNDTKYFSVQWLSNFSHEQEFIFIQNQYRLQINNIINMHNSEEYQCILNALKVFEEITSGYGINYDVSDSIEIIHNMMRNKIKSKYVRQIFSTYCINKKLLVLDYKIFKNQYPILYHALFGDEGSKRFVSNIILRLFPNLQEININNMYISETNDMIRDMIDIIYTSKVNTIRISWNVNIYHDFDTLYTMTQLHQQQFKRIKIIVAKEKGIYYLSICQRSSLGFIGLSIIQKKNIYTTKMDEIYNI